MPDFGILIISEEAQVWPQVLEDNDTEVHTVRYQQIVADVDLATTYDLVIIDLQETRRQLYLCGKLRPTYEGAILAFTSGTDPESPLVLYGAGVDECLVKPRGDRLIRAKIDAWRRRIGTR